jgi:hypothetical protein
MLEVAAALEIVELLQQKLPDLVAQAVVETDQHLDKQHLEPQTPVVVAEEAAMQELVAMAALAS